MPTSDKLGEKQRAQRDKKGWGWRASCWVVAFWVTRKDEGLFSMDADPAHFMYRPALRQSKRKGVPTGHMGLYRGVTPLTRRHLYSAAWGKPTTILLFYIYFVLVPRMGSLCLKRFILKLNKAKCKGAKLRGMWKILSDNFKLWQFSTKKECLVCGSFSSIGKTPWCLSPCSEECQPAQLNSFEFRIIFMNYKKDLKAWTHS